MVSPIKEMVHYTLSNLQLWVLSFVASVLFAMQPSFGQVTNQHLYDTMPNMQQHYHERLDKFHKEQVAIGKIIFLGNSITEGGEWHGLTNGTDRINRGIGGDVTFGVLHRLEEITQRAPEKLFILIGINDIGKDFPPSIIIDNYRRIVQRVREDSPSTQIYIQSILPVNPMVQNFPQHYDKGRYVVTVNRLLKDLASSNQVHFIDLYPLFLDDEQNLKTTLTYDGLHLNEAGYNVWTTFLKQKGYL